MYKIGDKLISKYYPDTIWEIYGIMEWSRYIDLQIISGPGINITNWVGCSSYLAVSKPENITGFKGLDITDFEII